jgi:hypothetical protein
MPDHVIGEHAQKDVGAHPSGEAVVNRAHVEVHGFYGTEGPLDLGESLIGGDNGGCIERSGWDAGSQHIKAVEGRLLLYGGIAGAYFAPPGDLCQGLPREAPSLSTILSQSQFPQSRQVQDADHALQMPRLSTSRCPAINLGAPYTGGLSCL